MMREDGVLVEILFDNGVIKNFNIESMEFNDLCRAMQKEKPYHTLLMSDGSEMFLVIQK